MVAFVNRERTVVLEGVIKILQRQILAIAHRSISARHKWRQEMRRRIGVVCPGQSELGRNGVAKVQRQRCIVDTGVTRLQFEENRRCKDVNIVEGDVLFLLVRGSVFAVHIAARLDAIDSRKGSWGVSVGPIYGVASEKEIVLIEVFVEAHISEFRVLGVVWRAYKVV